MLRRVDLRRLPFRPRPAVRWMAPATWLATALAVWRGRRVGEDAARTSAPTMPLTRPAPDSDGVVWIDFVSDSGDGFGATTTIAWLLAQEALDVGGTVTRRGRLLVHGGDMVYPSGTEATYRNRYVGPMTAVLPEASESLRIAAIPGNHDLHDGSGAWRELMTTEKRIGAWQTEQAETWFAVRLSDRWWLWAIDVESSDELGSAQREFFDEMARALAPGSQVVVVASEPAWIQSDDGPRQRTYRFVAEELVAGHGGRVRLWLSGDSHHYNRFVDRSSDAATHYVVAGGGGAFLSATHTIPERAAFGSVDLAVVPESIYPDRATSRRLVWTAPSLLWRNSSFSLVAAVVYVIAAWIRGSGDVWTDPAPTVAAVVYVLLLVLGAWLYTADRTWRSLVVAAGHSAAHLAVIGGLGAAVDVGPLATVAIFAMVGAVVGPVLVGLALIGANMLGCNDNELFSAIRVADYKCFVRLRIDTDEVLTMYPIGVDRIVRSWRIDDRRVPAVLQPDEPMGIRAIESPVVIAPVTGS